MIVLDIHLYSWAELDTVGGKCLLILNILTRIQWSNCQVAEIHIYNNNNNNNDNNNNNKIIVGFSGGHFLKWIFLSTASECWLLWMGQEKPV